ncbi:MAG: NAD(P)/FAD-dependent oxidoreductase [Pseudomonadota bacterium]
MSSHCTLLIVGAGAAGIGAGHAARRLGLDFRIIEASHRVGGRGLTEEIAPGVPWDLGCHWLHSGSINALAPVADSLGFHYDTDLPSRRFYLNGAWLSPEQTAAYDRYAADIWHRVETQYKTGQDRALMDSIDLDSVWAPYYTYWQSLMTSHDVDSFSALDLIRYNDTDENWPVREGLGALLTRHAEGLPIALNTAVHAIDWGGEGVSITTNRGTLTADKVIITVSTGVLAAQDIAFAPALPSATQEAIGNLPLGCYNNFAMLYEAAWPFDSDTPDRVDYSNGDDINFAFKLRCSGWPYIYCAVAGRHADWLEKQPQGESESLMMSALTDLFGSDFKRKITRFRASAWGQDPLVRGAYSASRPGCGDQRTALAEPIADRLYFAGEAASRSAFCTAHGAWETGRDAVIRSSGPLSPQ